MKFLKNYFLAFLVLLSFVAFGYTATVRAESGSDDSDDTEEVNDSGEDSDSDTNDDSDDDSNDEDESDDSGNDSASDLDDSDEDVDDSNDDSSNDSSDDSSDDDSDEDNSGPGNWKDKAPFPLFKKVGSERPGLFPGVTETKIKIEEKDGEIRSEFKMENRSPVAEARMKVGARIEAHSKNFENLKLRITSRVDKMEAEGIDVSVINSAISTLETKLDAANSAHEEMKDLFESDTADKASVEAAAEKIKSAMLEVHDAFKAVIEAMKEAVSASGKIETVS